MSVTPESDLITIFPKILLETESYEFGQKVVDKHLKSYFKFKNNIICSYEYLKKHPKTFNQITRKRIETVKNQIIDSENNTIKNFTIVLEKNVDNTSAKAYGENLLLFLSNKTYSRIIPDSIKIISYHKYGREIFVNDERLTISNEGVVYVVPGDEYIYKTRIWDSDLILVKCLERVNDTSQAGKLLIDRLFNSLSLYNKSIGVSYSNPKASIVLIVSAFESILELPRHSKTENFKQSIKLILGFNSYIEGWAQQIYELRSSIVHGEPQENKSLLIGEYRHYKHLEIAQEAFIICFNKILEKHHLIILKKEYEFRQIHELTNKIVPNKDKVEKILKRSAFSYKSFIKNKKYYRELMALLDQLTMTDYSATKEIPSLIKLLSSIAIEWGKGEIKETKIKISASMNTRLKEYYVYRNKQVSKIVKKMKQINANNLSNYKEKRKFEQLRMELIELNNSLDHSPHESKEYKFKFEEFVSKSMRSLLGMGLYF